MVMAVATFVAGESAWECFLSRAQGGDAGMWPLGHAWLLKAEPPAACRKPRPGGRRPHNPQSRWHVVLSQKTSRNLP